MSPNCGWAIIEKRMERLYIAKEIDGRLVAIREFKKKKQKVLSVFVPKELFEYVVNSTQPLTRSRFLREIILSERKPLALRRDKKIKLSISLNPEEYEKLKKLARKERMSLSGYSAGKLMAWFQERKKTTF